MNLPESQCGVLERVSYDVRNPWWYEHKARYHFVSQHVKGRAILDATCGTGLGSAMLTHDPGSFVIGFDISLDALAQAQQHLGRGRILQADCHELSFRNSSFDTVVSLETVEHLHKPERFLEEVHRILKPSGIFIVSTPNRFFTSPHGVIKNPFHIREYSPEEYLDLLKAHFHRVNLYGQRLSPAFRKRAYLSPELRSIIADKGWFIPLFWKAFNRLPLSLKDSLSRALWGLSFFPQEGDYSFNSDDLANASDFIGFCQP